MVQSEEWIETRGDSFRALKQDLLDLRLPGPRLLEHCADRVSVPTVDAPALKRTLLGGAVEQSSWTATASDLPLEPLTPSLGQLWWPLIADVQLLDQVQVGVLEARFLAGEQPRWFALLKVQAAGLTKEGRPLGLQAKVATEWSPAGEGALAGDDLAQGTWELSSFETRNLKVTEAENQLFDGSTRSSLENPSLADELDASGQDDALLAQYFHGEPLPERFLMNATTALAVVDINADGFDDLYLMPRHRPNRLLVNTGRGTFDEDAAGYGLDLPGACSSAAFADLDNDGDLDLVLGRVMEPTQVFLREDQTYVDHSQLFVPALPASASAVALADFNLDGVLDVYVATYAAGPLQELRNAMSTFVNQDQRILTEEKDRASSEFFDLRGPANALFLSGGAGGWRLAEGPGSGALEAHTLGASCSDYDQDGDPDLYCSNDFGPDVLFRNDGNGRFEDVSASVELIAGFGMGASWGDYDGDGDFDLYVSNMYSKAGTRIAGLLPGLAEHIAEAATGNFLLRNTGTGFEMASDNLGSGQQVAKAGWSYSSQFIDIDNDARLDLFCPNGYYTAPQALAKDEDL